MVADSKPSRRDAEERLRTVLHQALDEALRHYVVNLFSVWMKDDTGQPERARVGIEKGVKAWQHACKALDGWKP